MLEPALVAALLSVPVVVEEKLDGANVTLWKTDAGAIDAATRGGPGAIDRAGQLGPLRAWTARNHESIDRLLVPGRVLYAEWLWLEHAVAYDRLPDHLVGLDLLEPGGHWLAVDERTAQLRATSVATPPELARGAIGGVEELRSLLGPSRYGGDAAEGLVVRPLVPVDGIPRVAKLVREGFAARSDVSWARGSRRNPGARG